MASTPDDATQPPAWTGPVRDPSRVVQWIGWHLGELAMVTTPAVLAVTVDAWWAALSVLVAAGWLAHEIRTRRRVRALAAARPQHAVTDKPSGSEDQMEASA